MRVAKGILTKRYKATLEHRTPMEGPWTKNSVKNKGSVPTVMTRLQDGTEVVNGGSWGQSDEKKYHATKRDFHPTFGAPSPARAAAPQTQE